MASIILIATILTVVFVSLDIAREKEEGENNQTASIIINLELNNVKILKNFSFCCSEKSNFNNTSVVNQELF
jgi:hypothetical protein